LNSKIKLVLEKLKEADALIITSGAGMGVDSGLPDFRGNQGFWRAYPPYERLGVSFTDMANPQHFQNDSSFAWGFYGHRLNLYRDTVPHKGFQILLDIAKRYNLATFSVTSNVDGQFQKAGFNEDQIYEVHGSIHYLQCSENCSFEVWKNNQNIEVDIDTMKAKNLIQCKNCTKIARPNILMFGDYTYISTREQKQNQRFQSFLKNLIAQKKENILVFEFGAGKAISTIRHESENLVKEWDAFLVRINPRDSECHLENCMSFDMGSLHFLEEIEKAF